MFPPIGLHAGNLTAVTALVQDTTYFLYVGNIGKAISTCQIMTQVTTELDTGGATPYGEIGIFTGAFVASGATSLTRRGSADVSAEYGTNGLKKDTVLVSNITADEQVWIAIGSKAFANNFQLRGVLADGINSGVFQAAALGRLSELSTPVLAIPQGSVLVPPWIRLAV